MLSTCLIDNRAFIGEGCIILEHSWVAEYAMLAPGSVLQPFSYIPPGQVWAGNPARYVRDVEEDEKQFIRDTAQESHDLGNAHADEYALYHPQRAMLPKDAQEPWCAPPSIGRSVQPQESTDRS